MRKLALVMLLSAYGACDRANQNSPTADASIDSETSRLDATNDATAQLSKVAIDGGSGSCQVFGGYGRAIGAGPTAAVTYDAGQPAAEEMVLVRCGSLATLIAIDQAQASLDDDSTFIANLLGETSLGRGTKLLVESMKRLLVEGDTGKVVARSLGRLAKESDAFIDRSVGDLGSQGAPAKKPTATLNSTISLLLALGQPVLVEQIGAGKTLENCSATAASGLGDDLIAADANVIGLSGCLLYSKLATKSDLNNPFFSPNNLPKAFRTLARESGLVTQLFAASEGNRSFSLTSLHQLIYQGLGHNSWTEDDEGVVSNTTPAAADLEELVATFIDLANAGKRSGCGAKKAYVCHIPPGNRSATHTLCIGEPSLSAHRAHGDLDGVCAGASALDNFRGLRFHTGYNPSGGWEVDVVASKGSSASGCHDSNPKTSCDRQPLRFSFDGSKATADPTGAYGLQLEWRNGGFLPDAWVIDLNQSTYYRDALYQRATAPIDPTAYLAINYRNLLYDRCLDPMTTGGLYNKDCYGGGDNELDSAPFANAAFRQLYPGLTNVDNAFLFGSPENVARLALLLDPKLKLAQLSAIEALALLRLVTRYAAATPLASGLYAITGDHSKSVSQWDQLVSNWLSQ